MSSFIPVSALKRCSRWAMALLPPPRSSSTLMPKRLCDMPPPISLVRPPLSAPSLVVWRTAASTTPHSSTLLGVDWASAAPMPHAAIAATTTVFIFICIGLSPWLSVTKCKFILKSTDVLKITLLFFAYAGKPLVLGLASNFGRRKYRSVHAATQQKPPSPHRAGLAGGRPKRLIPQGGSAASRPFARAPSSAG